MTKLHVLLEQMEYTERSFAKEIGCSRTLVNLWAHGQKPSKRLLPKVCDTLGIEPEFLWPKEA
jgi:transcriptional regulator with XRE-family HTH domain